MATAVTMSPSNCDAMKQQKPDIVSSVQVPSGNTGQSSSGNTGKLEIKCKPIMSAFPVRGKRFHRKRRHSTSEEFPGSINAAKSQNAKHRRQGASHHKKEIAGDIILPTNFLLGGNIRDPLNLNSMLDEKVNRALNAVTPSSSPLPPRNSTISIVIPNDMTDPLGLNAAPTEEVAENSSLNQPSVQKKERERSNSKSRNRKRRKKSLVERTLPDQEDTLQDEGKNEPDSITGVLKLDNKCMKVKKNKPSFLVLDGNCDQNSLSVHVPQTSAVTDPIVSPVIPQKTNRNVVFSPKSRKRKASASIHAKNIAQLNMDVVPGTDLLVVASETKETLEKKGAKKSLYSHENESTSEKTCVQYSAVCSPSQNSQKTEKKGTNVKSAKPSFKKNNARFQYGNYSQYYGYRNPKKFQDCRMTCLKREWFKEKDVLDVGCNVGHLTLLIARDYSPRKIVGIDIDGSLINIARTNIRHYATASVRPPSQLASSFPDSMPKMYGPLVAPPVETGKDDSAEFPNNVLFFEGNYVPEVDEILRFQEPEYDVIMCMSVTKWMHMNWGDEGLKKTFERFFKQLRAGGKLIIEPQEWKSYGKKKKLTERIYKNYNSIELKPAMFPDYLIKVVGFESVEYLTLTTQNRSEGFKRPIQLYRKPE
nr:7SK snRNA methylphosphate capping enzyme-like [Ciona intestinalis]|eukprot:XP_002129700.1 7SK snRNA methylphosphate capping enzyme-like [Ciona intestinalis]